MRATLLRPADTSEVCRLAGRRGIRVAPVAVAAGFPSPAQDYYNGSIDLTEMLVDDQAATFIVRISGHSMTGAGIDRGDELLVDRSKTPTDGDNIVAILDGELTVKWLMLTGTGVVLKAENAEHPDIEVAELSELQVWGVATYCLHLTCGDPDARPRRRELGVRILRARVPPRPRRRAPGGPLEQ